MELFKKKKSGYHSEICHWCNGSRKTASNGGKAAPDLTYFPSPGSRYYDSDNPNQSRTIKAKGNIKCTFCDGTGSTEVINKSVAEIFKEPEKFNKLLRTPTESQHPKHEITKLIRPNITNKFDSIFQSFYSENSLALEKLKLINEDSTQNEVDKTNQYRLNLFKDFYKIYSDLSFLEATKLKKMIEVTNQKFIKTFKEFNKIVIDDLVWEMKVYKDQIESNTYELKILDPEKFFPLQLLANKFLKQIESLQSREQKHEINLLNTRCISLLRKLDLAKNLQEPYSTNVIESLKISIFKLMEVKSFSLNLKMSLQKLGTKNIIICYLDY